MRLPDFLIIGAMKSGTTSLYRDLMTNPRIYFPLDKEPGNLTDDDVLTEEGRRRYAAMYAAAADDQRCGDASTDYSKRPYFPGVPERARRVLGEDVRIVYMVREPVARIASHYYALQRSGQMSMTLDEALDAEPRMLDYTRYATQITPWIETFGPGRVRIIRLDDYVADRRAIVAALSEFLGVPPHLDGVREDVVFNRGDREPVAVGPLAAAARTSVYRHVVRPLLGVGVRERLRRALLPKAPAPPPPAHAAGGRAHPGGARTGARAAAGAHGAGRAALGPGGGARSARSGGGAVTTILAGYLLLVAAVVAIVILRDHERGRVDLLSVRNVGLAGFVLFQLTSAAYSLYADNHGPYLLDSREKSGLVFAAMATVFLVVSMWAYRRGWFVTSLADRAPTVRTVPTDAVLLAMAIVVTLLAAGLRLGVRLPLIVNVAQPLGTGMAAVAAGLVGWVWGRNLLNPVYAAYSMVIVSADMMISLSGAFGRRGIVAVGAALVWGMYYSAWRYLPTRMLLYRLALVTLPAVIFVALYTSVRSSAEHGRSAGEHLTEMRAEGNVVAGIMAMASGQFAGAVSMWLIDNYPEDFEYRHLMTLRYLAVYAVPRRWWESKPLPLSNHIAQQAQLARVDRSRLKIGPGIVGTAAAEGGWYAVVIYAILFGLYLRLLDELVLLNVHSPFIVLAMGSSMGHILGLSRGSVAAFTFMSLVTVVGATLFMLTLGRIVEYTSIGSTLPSLPDEDEADPDSEPAPYQEYEQEHDGHRRRFVE